jgi:hypothetical protein
MQVKKFKPQTLQLSLIISIVLTVLLTVVKVKNEAFNTTLKTLFYNAWLGQTIVLIMVFFVLIIVISMFKNLAAIKFTTILPIILCITIVSFFILFGLYH